EGPAGEEHGKEDVAPVEHLRIGRRDGQQIREHLVARDVEDLAFERVEHPAGRRDGEHEPLVPRDLLTPGAPPGAHQSGATMAAASCCPADGLLPSTMS